MFKEQNGLNCLTNPFALLSSSSWPSLKSAITLLELTTGSSFVCINSLYLSVSFLLLMDTLMTRGR